MGIISIRMPTLSLIVAALLLPTAPLPASAQFGLPGMPRVGDSRTTHVAILCHSAGEWKPVAI